MRRPPIFVHFSCRVVQDDILRARFKLKEYNKDLDCDEMVFINENLVDSSKKLLNAAKEQIRAKNLLGVWTKNFRVRLQQLQQVMHSCVLLLLRHMKEMMHSEVNDSMAYSLTLNVNNVLAHFLTLNDVE